MNRNTRVGAGLLGLGLGLLTATLFPWLVWAWPLLLLLVAVMLWRRAGTGPLRLGLTVVSLTWALGTLNFGLLRMNIPEVGGVNVTEDSRALKTLSATPEQLETWQGAQTFEIINAVGSVSLEGGAALELEISYRTTRRRANAPASLGATYNEKTRTLTLTGVDPETSERERRGLSADIVLKVPADANLMVLSGVGDIEVVNIGETALTTGVGDINAEALGGDLRAKSEVGDIRVHNSEGSVEVQSGVGTVSLSFDTPLEAPVRARTNIGDVTLSLPESSNITLKALSNLQSFSGDLERVTPTEARLLLGHESAEVLLQADAGEVEVRTY